MICDLALKRRNDGRYWCLIECGPQTSLALQGAYSAALEQDAERAGQWLVFAGATVASRVLEPLSARRADHEKARKHAKDAWHRALTHTHDVASCVRKAHALLRQRRADAERLPTEAHEDAMHKVTSPSRSFQCASCMLLFSTNVSVVEFIAEYILKQLPTFLFYDVPLTFLRPIAYTDF